MRGPHHLLDRVDLRWKLCILSIVGLAVLSMALTFISLTRIKAGMEERAVERQSASMAVAKNLLERQGVPLHLEGGQLKAGGAVLNGNFALVDQVHDLVGGVATIFMGDERVATNVTKPDGGRAIGTRLAQGPARAALFERKTSFQGMADILGRTYYVRYDPLFDPAGAVIGILFVGVPQDEYMSAVDALLNEIVLTSVVVTLLIGLLSFFIIRAAFGALGRVQAALYRVAGGDLAVSVPSLDRADEIGRMANAVEVSRNNALRARDMEEKARETEIRMQGERKAEMDRIAERFERSVKSVVESLGGNADTVHGAAASMSDLAARASERTETVAAAASAATGNVEIVASASVELSSSIQEISERVGQSARIAARAVDEADRADTMVQGLADQAGSIGEVVKLISDIASQTNLLALNATIEAARAGDAGKGFAVVAGEVKNLANQTARATDDISTQIGGVQAATGQAVEAIRGIGGTIDEISAIQASIAAAVEEQSAATREIARSITEASGSVTAIASQIDQLRDATREVGARSQGVVSSSEAMEEAVRKLGGTVGDFLTEVRAR